MDFSKFDTRGRAERGTPMQILDEWSREPIMDGDKPCRVLVKGIASASFQASQREKLRAASGKAKKDDTRVMEDVHNSLIADAMPFIAGFENIEHADGHALEATAEDIRWFLNLSFPIMGPKEDEDGNPVLTDAKDDDGNPIKVPEVEMKNRPFAIQIIEFASQKANELGN